MFAYSMIVLCYVCIDVCVIEKSCEFLQILCVCVCVCKIIIRTKSLKGKVVLEIFHLLSLPVSLCHCFTVCFTFSIIPGKVKVI